MTTVVNQHTALQCNKALYLQIDHSQQVPAILTDLQQNVQYELMSIILLSSNVSWKI